MVGKFLAYCSLILVFLFFPSCSENEESVPEYVGKWDVTHLYVNDEWVSVAVAGPASHMWKSYIWIKEDGNFLSFGHLGNAGGNYVANGNVIVCYSNGMEFSRYELIFSDGHTAEFYASVFGELMRIKCHLGDESDTGSHVCDH